MPLRFRRVKLSHKCETGVPGTSRLAETARRFSALDFLDSLDVADALDAAEFVDQAVEVADVNGLDDEVDDGASVGGGVGGGGADVGAVVGDDGGELLEEAGAVVAEDGEFDGVGLRLGGSGGSGVAGEWGPLDLDAAVGLVEEVLDVGTAAGVDGDAFTAGDVADDLFAADRVTTAGAVDEQVVLTFNLE